MSVGYDAFKNLQKLKEQEIADYYLLHKEVIKPFLLLQDEHRKLGSRATNALLNSSDEVFITHKPREYTEEELQEQLRLMQAITKKKK